MYLPCATLSALTLHTMRVVSSLLLLALLAACGYKGPLYLPKPKPAVQTQNAPGAADNTAKPPPAAP